MAEGATLAAIVNAPSLYDPALGDKQKANLTSRVAYVLDGMVAAGWLSQAERDKVTGPAETVPPSKNTAIAGPNGYIVDAVRKELGGTLRLSDSDIDRGPADHNDDQQGQPGRRGRRCPEVPPQGGTGRPGRTHLDQAGRRRDRGDVRRRGLPEAS